MEGNTTWLKLAAIDKVRRKLVEAVNYDEINEKQTYLHIKKNKQSVGSIRSNNCYLENIQYTTQAEGN